MKIVKTVLVVAALSMVGAMSLSSARADEWNKKTVITFNQPVEIPGQVLPAGTYTFQLMESHSDRHVVQVFTGDGMHIIATVLTINNFRMHATDKTVVTFTERTGDNPEALKGWFYPNNTYGLEFVYPKQRAIQLAVATNEPVPAIAVETTDLDTAPIVAVTPEQKEVPVEEAIQTTPPVATAPPVAEAKETAPVAETQQLPKTASTVPLIALLGLASLGVAFTLKRLAS
jgi:hypothetical protein